MSSYSPISADPRIKYLSYRSILLHTDDMAEPAQPLDINMLHKVEVVEELIQYIQRKLALDRRS